MVHCYCYHESKKNSKQPRAKQKPRVHQLEGRISSRARAPSVQSEAVDGHTKPAELSHNLDSKHHERGTRVRQSHWGSSYDAYRTRNACLRRNHAPSCRARAPSVQSEAVDGGRTKPAELSHNLDSRQSAMCGCVFLIALWNLFCYQFGMLWVRLYVNRSVLIYSKNAGGRPRLASVAFDGRYMGLALW